MIEISSPGLTPSNRDAGFPNLARGENPDKATIEQITAICKAELEAAGIRCTDFGIVWKGEVPTRGDSLGTGTTG